MNNLTLIKSATFSNMQCDFYSNSEEILVTRDQIGTALEYSETGDAIRKIHERHRDRLDRFSVTVKLSGTDGKFYDTYLYSAKGIYEICRWSQQPKANAFFDFVYDTLEAIRTSQYSAFESKLYQLRLETEKLYLESDIQIRSSALSFLESIKDRFAPSELVALAGSLMNNPISRPYLSSIPKANGRRTYNPRTHSVSRGRGKSQVITPNQALRQWRKKQKMTQKETAEKLGISKQKYFKIEVGYQKADMDLVALFASTFHLIWADALSLLLAG